MGKFMAKISNFDSFGL